MTRVRYLAVVGLMAVGKTTVGRAIGEHLGWRFDDSDAAIEAGTGLTVRELRDRRGQAALRAVESRHLLDALAGPGEVVIAAAAGTVEDVLCREALRRGDTLVVWLRASPSLLAERFAEEPHRPTYGDEPMAFLARQDAIRAPLYASLDPLVVDVDGRSLEAVIEIAIAAVDRRLGR